MKLILSTSFLLLSMIFYTVFYNNLILKNKIKDKDNIIDGCMVITGKYHTKYDGFRYVVEVDGKSFYLINLVSSVLPFGSRYYYFKDEINVSNKCYKVKYVKVYFLFYERRYIYDLVEK
ncbi:MULTISPECIES: hypothetical protein [Acinetobacter]|uniref:hypothetical protein n=1 Tax=Acinetobacter TaxID=469 RepID=UPI0015D3D2BB|nr:MULTISPECIES: hypothetical protein [Acinetobacter]MCL6235859.1 hypothetical protein [Acinetobacter amyesii]UIJ77516.1 hypothetical protein LXF01_16710 [Acinetobacter sp. SH20PTE14]